MQHQRAMDTHEQGQRAPVEVAGDVPVPRREEWAVMNKYKALQFEHMQKQEALQNRNKMQQFRLALDDQLNSRSNAEQKQRQQNKLYYKNLADQAEHNRIQEQDTRLKKIQTRKQVDQQNVHQYGNRSRQNSHDTGYHMEIGLKSDQDHIQKSGQYRKQMMDTLDIQLKQKSEEQKVSKMRNQELEEMHKLKQDSSFLPGTRRQFGQNQGVYQYYQQLDRQRRVGEVELERKFVDEAKQRHERAEVERERQETDKRIHNKEAIQQTLGQQVKEIKRKRIADHTTNPEDVSFQFIAGIFDSKYAGYDKVKYKQDLQKQTEENRLRKQRENLMNDQEYKLNMNQLSKAVMGDYSQKNYLDRSMGAIGEKYQIERVEKEVKDDDVEVIKSKLQNIRHRGNLSTIS